jgi:hypothetical protein
MTAVAIELRRIVAVAVAIVSTVGVDGSIIAVAITSVDPVMTVIANVDVGLISVVDNEVSIALLAWGVSRIMLEPQPSRNNSEMITNSRTFRDVWFIINQRHPSKLQRRLNAPCLLTILRITEPSNKIVKFYARTQNATTRGESCHKPWKLQ